MKKIELKVECPNPEAVEACLKDVADFIGELHSIHSYFNQPEGKVLKLVEDETGVYQTVLERRSNRFVFVSKDKVSNKQTEEERLEKRFGLKCTLHFSDRYYQHEGYQIGIYRIQEVGDFVILTGEDPSLDLLSQLTGIENPVQVTESFDNLLQKAK